MRLTPQIRRFQSPSLKDVLDATAGTDSFWVLLMRETFYENFGKIFGGLSGIILRRLILPLILKKVGKKVIVEEGVNFLGGKRISLGSNVIIRRSCSLETRFGGEIILENSCFVNQFSIISAKKGTIVLKEGVNVSSHCRIASTGDITIGKSSLIASHCYIGAPNHSLESFESTVEKEVNSEGVYIGNNVWIGANSVILDGVRIGDNTVIGANSFVNNDIPENVVAFGTPAKVYRERLQ